MPPSSSAQTTLVARALIDRLKAGESVDQSSLTRLVQALQAQHTKDRIQAQPLASPTHRPPSLPTERVVRESEAFLEREPWNLFQSEVARYECLQLTEQERRLSEQMAQALFEETVAFRVTEAKPIGAALRAYQGDYISAEVRPSVDPRLEWRGLSERLDKTLLESERVYLMAPHIKANRLFLTNQGGLADQGLMLLGTMLCTPDSSTYADIGRPVPHRSSLLVREGKFTQLLKQGKLLRLVPIAIQLAAMRMNPETRVFFDGSLSGSQNLLGRAPNPLLCLVSTVTDPRLYHIEDTSKPVIEAPRIPGINIRSLAATALQTAGIYVSSEGPPRLSLQGFSLARRNIARVQKGDRSCLEKALEPR